MMLKSFLFLFGVVNVYCINPCNYDLITDFNYEDCQEDSSYYYNKKEGSCFPRCIKKIENIEKYKCDNQDRVCPSGYVCKLELCVIDKDSCFKYHANYSSNEWFFAIEKPNCLIDGTWASVQCKGKSGDRRCFCNDSAGKRIYGEKFNYNSANMTCACSRKKEALLNSQQDYPILHCDSLGNYEALQCNAKHCWCADELTGKIVSVVLPEKLIKYLPCYSNKDIDTQYLRQCDSEKYAQTTIIKEIKIRGTVDASFSHLLCDNDGAYGPYSIGSDRIDCKWRDNTNLGGTTLENILPNTTNCNCLRDRRIFSHNKICLANGNYKPLQGINGNFYCVDDDGFRKSDYFTNALEDCSKYI